MNTIRWILIGLLLAAGFAGGAFIVAGGGGELPAPPPEARRVWKNDDCKSCHAEVWDEWYASWHRMAYIDPLYKKMSGDYADKSCDDCHIPRNIPEVGFGPRTLPRASDKASGINCLSCHYDGKSVVALNANPTAPCAPRAAPELGTELGCIGCHNQHKLHEEWRKTVFFKNGVDCNDCHMPVVERQRPGRVVKGRHHGYISSRNRDLSKLGVRVTARGPTDAGGTAETVSVAITNEKSGHDFPSDSRHKAADLITRFLAKDGRPIGEPHLERFHIPARDALDQVRTTIPHGETRSFDYPVPIGAAQAEVRLLYRILKNDPNDDSQQLFRKVVRW